MWSIIGSEAIASGVLTRGRLRWNYTAVHPDVYLPNGYRRDVLTNAHAAWLWTRRTGIIAGRAAAALYGVDAVADSTPIELIAKHRGRRPGIIVREERIGADEVRNVAGMSVTSPARTALDLARQLLRNEAVVILDQLAAVTQVDYPQAAVLMDRHRGARGIPRAAAALALMNGGTRCPEETRLRLRFHDAGLPAPQTSIVLSEGPADAVIGMGWEQAKVAVSYVTPNDGSITQRIQRQELLQRLGWFEIQVADTDPPMGTVFRARDALRRRTPLR